MSAYDMRARWHAIVDDTEIPGMVFKKACRQGRSERRGESYSFRYVEPLSDARTQPGAFFNTMLAPL